MSRALGYYPFLLNLEYDFLSSETFTLLITQILCSVFVVVFLLKIIPARERKLRKFNVELEVEVSKLSDKVNELTDSVSYLSTELDIKNDLTNKQEVEVNSLKKQVKSSHSQINSLQKEVEEKQSYLMNCWDKIKKLESISGKDTGQPKVQPISKTNTEYNICKACDRAIQYCSCAR